VDVARRGRNAVVQLGIRTLVMRGVTVLGTIVLARLLSPSDFGVFAVLVFWMSVLLQFGDVGLSASLVQQDHVPTREELGSAWVVQQALWIPIVVVVWLIAPFVAHLLGGLGSDFEWQLRAVSLTLVTSGLRGVPSAMLMRDLRFGVLASTEVAQHVTFYLVAVVMAVNGFGAWSFVAAVLAQAVTGCVLVNLAWGHLPTFQFRRAVARRQIGFGASYQASSLITYSAQMSTPLFGWFSGGLFAVGQLQFAWRIGQLTSIFDDIVSRVTFPAFSRLQGDHERLGRVIRDAIVLATIGVVATQGWVVSVASSLVPIVFGDKWLPAVLAIQVLCLSTLLTMPLRFLRSLVNSQGRAREGLVAALVGVVCLVVSAPPLVIAFGLPGAGIAYLFAAAVMLVLYARIAGDLTPRVERTVARIALLGVPSGVAAWLVVQAVAGVVGLIASGLVYLAVYGLLLALFARPDVLRGFGFLLARGAPSSDLVPDPLDVPPAAVIWTED
jgi:O-antigen/teichoic acid export membrane protein